jgi:toxin ParE1/3/4
MKLVIRGEVVDDLDGIYDWIAKDSASAAVRVVRRLLRRIDSILLPELVTMGRPGKLHGTRELIEWPYIIVYTVTKDGDEIVIQSVVHGAWVGRSA